jgi:hypothetical protein
MKQKSIKNYTLRGIEKTNSNGDKESADQKVRGQHHLGRQQRLPGLEPLLTEGRI